MSTTKGNSHIGSSFDSFLEEEGMLEEVTQAAAARMLEVMSEHGDALTIVREIDHFSYFPTPEGRARFLDNCLAAGFRLRAQYEGNDPAERFAVIVFHDDVPDETVFLKVHAMLTELATAEGGRYDGWETQLIA